MTTSKLAELERRMRTRGPLRDSFAMSLAARIRQDQIYATRIRFPNPMYQRDPVLYFRQVLGVEPWSRQVDIMQAVRDHKRVAVRSGHKVSKLLALDTPVPTPVGWSTIGELQPGDRVFDERGQPCNVTGLSPIEVGRACFEVVFDDDTRVVTDATHAWRSWTHRARKQCDRRNEPRTGPGELTTTDAMRRTLRAEHAITCPDPSSESFVQRMVIDVRRCRSVPVRCIEVDSPSHLFLVSRAFIPTHNSHTAAGIALWFYCSWHDARVVMSSTTARQVDQILWRELRMMRARSGRCVDCKREDPEGLLIPRPCPHSTLIEGEQGDLARTGLKAPDFREVVGFTAREAEAVAGISGSNLLYILDEASGIDDVIYEAIEGNRAGGARTLLLGNPTQNQGEFFEAFHAKSHLYFTLTVSSEETPNVVQGEVVIPGLATREWIEEKRLEWGEDSPLYKIRILGEHATYEEGRIFSVHTIEQAELRWPVTAEAGRLFIGVDPAGESGLGDETIFAARRGLKLLALMSHRGLSPELHVTYLVRAITDLRLPREVPVIVVDAEGSIGLKLARLLSEYLDQYPDAFELVRVRASERAMRQPIVYDRVRDELTANLEAWFRDGGAIVEDTRLAAELHAFEWIENVNGRLKCTPKDALRKQLGRSPDRFDALALSTWEPLSLRAANDNARPRAANDNDPHEAREQAFDPYASGDIWRADR